MTVGRMAYKSFVAGLASLGRIRGIVGGLPFMHNSSYLAVLLIAMISPPVFAQDVLPPSNLAASVGDSMVTLTWDEPAALAVTGFEVRYGESDAVLPEDWTDIDWKKKVGTDTVTHPVTGLTNGREHTFEVRAFTADGRGQAARVTATPVSPPVAPEGLRASAGAGTVLLAWDDPYDDTITAYETRYGESRTLAFSGWIEGWTEIYGSDAGTTSLEVRDLANWVEHTFEVRAKNAAGAGDSSRVTFVLGPAPSNLAASAGDSMVTLTWDEPTALAVTGFEVRYGESDAVLPEDWTDIDWKKKVGTDTVTHPVTGLTNGREHTFEVRAFTADGRGQAARVTATPVSPPVAPEGLRASAGAGTVLLAWDDPYDNTITAYETRYGESSTLAFSGWIEGWTEIYGSDAGTTSLEVSGPANWVEHTFEVRAKNAAGAGDSSRVTFVLGPAPSNLAASAGDSMVTLTWDEPTALAVTGFEVRYGESDAVLPEDWTDIGWQNRPLTDTVTHEVSGLTNGIEHTFEVRAFTADGRGQSARVTVRMPPAALRDLTGAAGPADVTLTWADPEDASITGYQVRYGASGTALPDWSADEVVEKDAGVTTHTVRGLTIDTQYRFEVRAQAGTAYGEATAVTVTTEAATPTNLRATVASGDVVLTWDAPAASVTGYQILRRVVRSGYSREFRVIATTGRAATTYEDESVGFGWRYTYRVKAMYGEVLSQGSRLARAYVPEPPAAPEGLAAREGDGTVVLTWDDPRDDTLTGYQVRYEESGTRLPTWSGDHDIESDAATTTHEVGGLTNGNEYTFEVRPRNAAGYYGSSRVTATPRPAPAAPDSLAAMAGDGTVVLTWADPEDASITGYQVRYGQSRTALPAWSGDHDVESNASTTRHTVRAVAKGVEYRFEVRARRASAYGASSGVTARLPLPAPEGLSATPGDGQVTLSWRDPQNPYITRYQVRWAAGSAALPQWSDDHTIDDSGAATTTHTVEDLTNGRKYTFEVRARVDDVSGASAPSMATLPPPAPADLEATPGDGRVALTWTDPENDAITGYQIRYSDTDVEQAPWTVIAGSGAATTRHTVPDLANGRVYTIEVRAHVGTGAGDAARVTVPLLPLPGAPRNLRAALDDGNVELTWDPPVVHVESVRSYRIAYWYAGRSGTIGTPTAVTRWEYVVYGGEGIVRYTFKVRAVSNEGFGDWSENVTIEVDTGGSIDPLPPPANLAATAGVGQVLLAWTDPDDDTITGYQVRYSDRGAALPAWSDRHNITSTASTTSHPVTGLTDGTAYTFQVRAKKGDVAGASASVTQPAAPGNLGASAGDASATLSWANPQDAAIVGYQVRWAEAGAALPAWGDIGGSGAATTSHAVTGVTHTTAYTFHVRAKTADADGAYAGVTQPAPPGALTASVGDGSVTLSWDDPQNVAVTGYQYRYRVGGGSFTVWTGFTQGGGAATSGTIGGLTNGSRHTFEVRAKAGNVDGAAASLITIPGPPAPPANLRAGAGNGSVTLTWNDPNNDTIDGYHVRYGRSNVNLPDWSDDHNVDNSGPTTTRHRVSGLTNGRAYTFDVRAYNEVGVGVSDSVVATPTVPPCETLTIDAINDVKVSVNQSFSRTARARGGCAPITITMSGAPSGVTIESGTGRSKTISSSGLSPEGTHTVTVTARDGRGTTATEPFDIIVDCPSISVSQSPANPKVAVGDSVIVTASASGGCGSHTFSDPSGLSWVTKKDESDNQYIVAPTVGTPTGPHYFNVIARDDHDNTGTGRLKVTVIPPSPPECSAIVVSIAPSSVTVKAGGTKTATASAEADCPPITFGKKPPSGPPTWVTVTSTGGITINPPATAAGGHTAVVTATDNQQNTADKDLPITVCEPVAIGSISTQTVPQGGTKTVSVTASGGCGTINMSHSSPDWVGMVSTGGSGTITISPPRGTPTRDYTATVTARDSDLPEENKAETSFKIKVVAPPVRPCDVTVGGLPSGTVTATVCEPIESITAVASGDCPPYTFRIMGGPAGVSIGDSSGVISGKPTQTGDFTVTVTATPMDGQAGTGSFDLEVICPGISVGGLPSSTVKATLDQDIDAIQATASGGQSPYEFEKKNGPSWVTVTSSGRITGTPTETGEFTVEVEAKDDCDCKGTGSFTIKVCEPVAIASISDIDVFVNGAISSDANATGGCGKIEYSMAGAPSGVSIDADNGNITGTAPSAPDTFDVTVTATDKDYSDNHAETGFAITVKTCSPVSIASIADPCVTVGGSLSLSASATGGCGTINFSKKSGSSWVTVSSGGSITGTAPSTAGTHPVTVTAKDSNDESNTDDESFTVTVVTPLTIAELSDVVVTWFLDMTPIQVSVSGGKAPYSYSLESAPMGISIDEASGEISGTPTQLGSATVTVVVDDDADQRATESFTLTIALPGDFNGDGRRDAADAKLFNKKMGLGRSDTGYDKRMDLNGDGTINYADFVILAGYIESDAAARGDGESGNSGKSGD